MKDKNSMNIVWFCTDQQRWDTIHSLGNPYIKTPNIDRLAEEGVAFTRAYTQSPVCTPSRSCFLTGRYPRTTRAFFNGNDTYSKDEVLVTKFLADRGYTCGLTGKLHLTSAQGRMEERTEDGYSYFKWSHHPQNDWPNGENEYQNWLKDQGQSWENIYGGQCLSMATPRVENPRFTGKSIGVPKEYHQTTWCVEKAIEFINQNQENPWLVSINVFDPHPPLDPPQEYKDRLKVEDMPLPLWKDGELDNKPPHQQQNYIIGGQNGRAASIAMMSDYEKKEQIRDYYAQIELIDDQLGRLMDYLEEANLRDNTVIIFMSDHGELSGDHGLYWKGAFFYEALTHVPLIISAPTRFKKGLISNALVELVDIAPTLVELAGYEVPYYMQGKSLFPILKGEAPADFHKEAVYSEYYYCMKGCHDDVFGTMYFDGQYKIINYHGKDFGELYDLHNDPNEFDNLWDQPEFKDLKAKIIQKNFDNAIMKNMDFSMHRINNF
jgi:arylsulfatase A-like enzyme